MVLCSIVLCWVVFSVLLYCTVGNCSKLLRGKEHLHGKNREINVNTIHPLSGGRNTMTSEKQATERQYTNSKTDLTHKKCIFVGKHTRKTELPLFLAS